MVLSGHRAGRAEEVVVNGIHTIHAIFLYLFYRGETEKVRKNTQ